MPSETGIVGPKTHRNKHCERTGMNYRQTFKFSRGKSTVVGGQKGPEGPF